MRLLQELNKNFFRSGEEHLFERSPPYPAEKSRQTISISQSLLSDTDNAIVSKDPPRLANGHILTLGSAYIERDDSIYDSVKERHPESLGRTELEDYRHNRLAV